MYRASQMFLKTSTRRGAARRGERTRLGKYNDEPLCREQRVLMNEFFLPNRPFYFLSREIKCGACTYSEVASAMQNIKCAIIYIHC